MLFYLKYGLNYKMLCIQASVLKGKTATLNGISLYRSKRTDSLQLWRHASLPQAKQWFIILSAISWREVKTKWVPISKGKASNPRQASYPQ